MNLYLKKPLDCNSISPSYESLEIIINHLKCVAIEGEAFIRIPKIHEQPRSFTNI